MTNPQETGPDACPVQTAENEGMPTIASKAARTGRAPGCQLTGKTAPCAAPPQLLAHHKEKT
jgi:hypothetical protein